MYELYYTDNLQSITHREVDQSFWDLFPNVIVDIE